jgi:ribosomal protein L3 glutamine methyltransferase
MNAVAPDVITALSTIRDYIRWGASQFARQGVVQGHGTGSHLDEAAALVLHTLGQPYDLAERYLDCALTSEERRDVADILLRRISERKPSAYLTHEALFAGLSFYVDERVLVPRSPIAELIAEGFEPWVDASQVMNVLDLCTGSGCIAIACAYAFPDAEVDAVDLSEDALAVARINVEQHELDEQLTLVHSDLFEQLPNKTYDIIVSNPPYVSRDEWQNLAPEYHAEPSMGFLGGDSGLDLVLRILTDAGQYLDEQGILVVEVGSSAQTLQDRLPQVAFHWLEFERGGDGVFLLTAQQVSAHHSLFKNALKQCLETP